MPKQATGSGFTETVSCCVKTTIEPADLLRELGIEHDDLTVEVDGQLPFDLADVIQ